MEAETPATDGPVDPRLGPPAFIFDLDGTLLDSVYQHVLAWRAALEQIGVQMSVWRIHRRIGMSGGLFLNALLRESPRPISADDAVRAMHLHDDFYAELVHQVRPLPGASELLRLLTEAGVRWSIATSTTAENAARTIGLLELEGDPVVVTRGDVSRAKPDPDLLVAAARRLGVATSSCMVVGDSVWDLLAARRCGSLGVGVLSGGYGSGELERAGAYRIYDDPADLLSHLDELGVRVASMSTTTGEIDS